jgi:membrane protease YdiL (CAAX protease family)
MLMQSTQSATVEFFGPVTVAWLAACAGWFGLERVGLARWPRPEPPATRHPWRDLLVAVLAAAAILGLGALWRQDLLLPRRGPWWMYQLNTLIIYAPIAVAMLAQRTPMSAVLLARAALPRKLVSGFVLGALAVTVYLALRGELAHLAATAARCGAGRSLAHVLPVFLEGVAVAFLWTRLRAAIGPVAALVVPCLLFAAAHVPRGIESGHDAGTIAAFFALNTLLPLAILATVARSRDVVWVGVVHWIMDVAIRAFE